MRKPKFTIFEEPVGQVSEGAKARWWRERIMRFTREELATRIGYSVSAIDGFERNCNSQGKLIGKRGWLRYRNACAAVAAKPFNWALDTLDGSKRAVAHEDRQ